MARNSKRIFSDKRENMNLSQVKILSIGSDRSLLDENSETRKRIIEYGKQVKETRIIVFNKHNANNMNCARMVRIENNIFAYPTNSRSRWFYVFDAIKIGKKIIESWKSEVENSQYKILISCQDPFECGFAGYFLKKKFDLPLQLQIHTDFLSPYFARHSLLNRLRVKIAMFLIPRANCIRVVSKRVADSIGFAETILKNRLTPFASRMARPRLRFLRVVSASPAIDISPVFVDVKKIQEATIKTDLHKKYPQFDFIILMASRLSKEKNIKLAIEALHNVKTAKSYANNTKVGLIIVGEGLEISNLKSQISNLKISENIIIENWTDDLSSYYKTSDLFLLTSNYEGYGRTLVEAAIAGCNIVSSDVGIAREILDIKNIFQVGDVVGLRVKIEAAIRGELKKPKFPTEVLSAGTLENYHNCF